jgi:pimeloyl-ACP methyl ester carboxylesterase
MTAFKPRHPKGSSDKGRLAGEIAASTDYAELVAEVARHNAETLQQSAAGFFKQWSELAAKWPSLLNPGALADFSSYATDFAQRSVLFTDILRRRGNNFVTIERESPETVLAYEYDLILVGADLPRPINYSLVKINPGDGFVTRDELRPYVIIDPRAGHGSGIGGFKDESEVGVAIRAGHPVYFVIFTRHPVPGQTLADICRGEAEFVREVRRRHPDSPKPVVVGNCQGGWATMLLAAANPDLTGPVVANGSPLSYWSGVRGKNPMRYLGGITGGVTPAMLMADLGNGEFDGANLVLNFEALNPANTWWRKYYDVFDKTDDVAEHFLRFEEWWSSFYYLTADEIRWIVENLFVGNKFARGGVYLDSGLHVDLRNIRAPIILFASHGDNITPVPQALNWITDIYKSAREIQAHGQRIIYTVHESVGHLGIFVSSKVAMKEHKEITTTLRMIEALAPGLYELKIVDVKGEGHDRRYEIAFEERQIEDIAAFDDDRQDETPFAAVAEMSEALAAAYRATLRPAVRAMSSDASAKLMRDANPMRAQRYALSDLNPAVAQVAGLADQVRANRKPAEDDNPFRQYEREAAKLIESAWDLFRVGRDGMVESMFYGLYTTPAARALAEGEHPRISDIEGDDLRRINDVSRALESIEVGGYPNAFVRILILLARSRKSVRRDRLERSNEVLSTEEPFSSLSPLVRSRIIRQQTLIVEFEPALALATLPKLLPTREERETAIRRAMYVLGAVEEMNDDTLQMLEGIRHVLGLAEPPAKTVAPAPAAKPRRKARVAAAR